MSSAGLAPSTTAASDAGESADPLLAANASLTDAVREYKRRVEAIEAQKTAVETQLDDAKAKLALAENGGEPPGKSEYDLSQDDWKELAKNGKARARFPCPDPTAWGPSPKMQRALGFSPDDEKVIRDAMEQSNERIWAAIRPLCIKAVEGNARIADKLGPSNCQTLVLDLADPNDENTERVTRKVAEIRAGMIPVPADLKTLGGYGQMLYTLSGEAKAVEHQLAQSFGPDLANRVMFGHDAEWCSLEFGPRPPEPKR